MTRLNGISSSAVIFIAISILVFPAAVTADDFYPTQPFRVNLVTNGDANNGLSGWTQKPSMSSCEITNIGKNVFKGGGFDGECQMTQTIYFSSVPYPLSKWIVAGKATMNVYASLGGYGSQSDDSTLTVTQLDSAGSRLGSSVVLGPVTSAMRNDNTEVLPRSSTNIPVYPGCSSIVVVFYSTHSSFFSCDGSGVDFVVSLYPLTFSRSSTSTISSPTSKSRSMSEASSSTLSISYSGDTPDLTRSSSISESPIPGTRTVSMSLSMERTDPTSSLSPSYSASPTSTIPNASLTTSVSPTVSTSPSFSPSPSNTSSVTNTPTKSPSHSQSMSPAHSTSRRSRSRSSSVTSTTSTSATASLTVSLTDSAVLPYILAIPAGQISTTALLLASSITSFAGASALAQVGMQVMLQMSSCTPLSRGEQHSPTVYLLSPFFDLGGVWMAIGNVLLMLTVTVLHGIVAVVCGYSRRNSDVLQRARFPHWSFIGWQLWWQGALYGSLMALRGLYEDNSAPSSIGYAIAAGLASLLPPLCCVWVWSTCVRGIAFVSRDPSRVGHEAMIDPMLIAGKWYAFALPTTAWGPRSTRLQFGVLFTCYSSPRVWLWMAWGGLILPLLLMLHGVWSQLLGETWCPIAHYTCGAILFVAGVVVIFLNPYRLPLKSLFTAASFLILAATAVAEADTILPRRNADILGICQSLVLCFMSAYVLFCEVCHRTFAYASPADGSAHSSDFTDALVVHDDSFVDGEGFDDEDGHELMMIMEDHDHTAAKARLKEDDDITSAVGCEQLLSDVGETVTGDHHHPSAAIVGTYGRRKKHVDILQELLNVEGKLSKMNSHKPKASLDVYALIDSEVITAEPFAKVLDDTVESNDEDCKDDDSAEIRV